MNTNNITRAIKERSLGVDVSINTRIKSLQKKLVELSFRDGDNSKEYFITLGLIKPLRTKIFKTNKVVV